MGASTSFAKMEPPEILFSQVVAFIQASTVIAVVGFNAGALVIIILSSTPSKLIPKLVPAAKLLTVLTIVSLAGVTSPTNPVYVFTE